MTQPRLKHFGWGREGEGITPEEEAFVWARIKERFRIDEFAEVKPPRLDEIELHPPRVKPPTSLASTRPEGSTISTAIVSVPASPRFSTTFRTSV